MFVHLSDLSKAFLYYTVAFGLCIGVTLLASHLRGHAPNVAMFTPLAAVLLMLLVFTRDGYSKAGWRTLGMHRIGLGAWGMALLLPAIVLGFAYGGVWFSGVATFVVPDRIGSVPSYVLDLVVSIIVVALLGGLGEEIGWRGYFLPHLMNLGVRPALLLSGLLHGLWHLPVIIWTHSYHAAGNRFIVVPLFLLTLTMAGVCYGYLRLTSGSVWPAAIAHSAFNIFWERFNAFTIAASPLSLEYLAGESGVLTLGALVAVAGWLAYRLTRQAPPGSHVNPRAAR